MVRWAIALICAAVLWLAACDRAAAQDNGGLNPGPVEKPSLKDVLEKGLKARRPVEFEFIGTVVQLVDDQQLPQTMVQSTFLWARKKRVKYPFQYFEFALRQRAKDELGIELPDVPTP
jgi:hypothetical protein